MISKIKEYIAILTEMNTSIKSLQESVGRIESRQILQPKNYTIEDSEFKVYSQWGEDGIIQYLINHIAIERSIFVEFGVQNFVEANCRFLMINNNWSGLVIDGTAENIDYIKKDPIYWRYNLKAECAFIDKNNINDLIEKNGIEGDIGLLSVDIDGNDYWVWEAIECISPRIVVCEYNSLFGSKESVTVPYSASFFRTRAHYSNLYYGASITALTKLAKSKGYALVAGNKAGNNIFFVRNDLLDGLQEKEPESVYVEALFRESRDEEGGLTFLSMKERLKLVEDMPVFDVEASIERSIKDIYK